MRQKVNDELKQHFRPEFLNRIDETIVFPPLSPEQVLGIVDLMVARITAQLRDQDIGLVLTDSARMFLANAGHDPMLGARPLRRTIQREIEDTLSERILFNDVRPGQTVIVDRDGDPPRLTFRAASEPTLTPDALPV